jgi:hypothetical protein
MPLQSALPHNPFKILINAEPVIMLAASEHGMHHK